MRSKRIDKTRLRQSLAKRGVSMQQASIAVGYCKDAVEQAGRRGIISAPLLEALKQRYDIREDEIAEPPGKGAEIDSAMESLYNRLDDLRVYIQTEMYQISQEFDKLRAMSRKGD